MNEAAAKRFSDRTGFLVLVVSMTGLTVLYVWVDGSPAWVGSILFIVGAARSWDDWRRPPNGEERVGWRDSRLPAVVILLLAGALLACSVPIGAAEDAMSTTALKVAAALGAVGLAAVVATSVIRHGAAGPHAHR